MKKLFLTMASLVMLASMTFAQDETPMLPSQHGLTDHQPAWGSSQTFDLTAGWSWWSTYINGVDLATLETALGENGQAIKSATQIVQKNASGVWAGTLSELVISKMYALKMASATEVTVRGSRAQIDQVPIETVTGWNWIAYPVSFNTDVNYALTGITNAQNGDAIKSLTQAAYYNESTQTWVGTLSQLEPGKGYMIKSQNATTFTYPTVPSEGRGMLNAQYDNTTEWQPEMASNPTNMNMIAVVNLNDEELRSENVEIGVFNGEICRGAVHPMYVDFLDQYVVFLTMYGEENEPFSFRLLDNETGDIYESNEASVSYKADNIIGALRSPFELNFNTKNMVANHLHLFPNPVHHGEMVNMILPEGSVTVEVVNMLGSTVKSMRMTGSELSADMAPGVYTVKVIDAEGHVYVDKLIVK